MSDRNKWDHSTAVSVVHKALRRGDRGLACYAAARLAGYEAGVMAAWRRCLAFPAEDIGGRGVETVVALYHTWRASGDISCLYTAVCHLCYLVEAAGSLNREADELLNASIYWLQGGRTDKPWLPAGGLWPGVDVAAEAGIRLNETLMTGRIEDAAFIAMWMLKANGEPRKQVWPVILASGVAGFGARHILKLNAFHSAWRSGFDDNNVTAAILLVCRAWAGEKTDVTALAFETSAVARLRRGEEVAIPEEAMDMHTGHGGTIADFWEYVNPLGPASPWRADAMKMEKKPKKGAKSPQEPKQMGIFG